MLALNKKGETLKQIEQAIGDACDLGFDVKIFCIVGMPYETEADIEDSLQLVQKFPVKRVILNNPIPYPGTELFETVKKNHWFIKQPEEYLNTVTENEIIPVFETPELSREDRIRILRKCRRIEKQVTRNGVRNMINNKKIIGFVAGYFFSTQLVEKMFFKSRLFRQFMENIRYKRFLFKRKHL